MFQRITPIMACASLLLISCAKNDIKFPQGKHTRCEVEQMDGPAPFNFRMTGGIKKTYNEVGLVNTLYTRVYTNMSGHVDSIKYEFAYSGNIVHVKASYQTYRLDFWPDTGFSGEVGAPEGEPWSREFDIVLDKKTGNTISAGNMHFTYKSGRLAYFTYEGNNTIYPFVYDNRGNITREPGGAKYEYDYSRTAKDQQYFSTGHHELYSLVELLGWLPPSAKNLRTRYINVLEGDPEYVFGSFDITNHIVNSEGRLISYKVYGNPVTNYWKCEEIKLKVKN